MPDETAPAAKFQQFEKVLVVNARMGEDVAGQQGTIISARSALLQQANRKMGGVEILRVFTGPGSMSLIRGVEPRIDR